jgi:cytochrome P450
MRAAGNTIGQIVTGRDLKMLDSPDSSIAPVLLHIGHNLAASQNLYRKGKLYRMLPQTPERRAAKEADAYVTAFLKGEMTRTIDEYKSEDRPMKDAALETKSLTDYVLHALDDDGEKMPMYLAIENISTLLGAGQVTTSSLLAWLLMTLSDHPREAEELYAALLDAGLTRETEELATEKLNAIDRLDWFVKETQRLYNPAFQPTRCALQGGSASSVHRKLC